MRLRHYHALRLLAMLSVLLSLLLLPSSYAATPRAVYLISDGQFVNGPNVGQFDLHSTLKTQFPEWEAYYDEINAAQGFYSINPRLLLTMLDFIGYDNVEKDNDTTITHHIEELSKMMSQAFYDDYYAEFGLQNKPAVRTLVLGDDTSIQLDAETYNPGTYAVLMALAPWINNTQWQTIHHTAPNPVTEHYRSLFPTSDPYDGSNILDPRIVPPNGFFKFPFPRGDTWRMTGGPHGWNGGTTTPYSSLDFQPTGHANCAPFVITDRWITSAQAGTVTHAQDYQVTIAHSGGWETSYYHVANIQVSVNTAIAMDTPLGNPSCYGEATGVHGHMALKLKGAYQPIHDTTLEGWRVVSHNVPYQGHLERDGQIIAINEGVTSTILPTVINGYVDEPAHGSGQSLTTRIRGWAKADEQTISRVEVWINGAYFRDAIYGDSRPDVGGAYGWHFDWDTRDFPNQTYTIQVLARTATGITQWLKTPNGHSDQFELLVWNPPHPCLRRLFRYTHTQTYRHFYTQDWSALGAGTSLWHYDGLLGYAPATTSCHTSNVGRWYRLFRASTPEHFYTMDSNERQAAESQGFVTEPEDIYLGRGADSAAFTKPVYRFNHPQRQDHFYTSDAGERGSAEASGYVYEGIAGYAFDLVNRNPNKPTLQTPSAGATLTSRTINLTWQDAGDPDNYPRSTRDYAGKIRQVNTTWQQTLSWTANTAWSVTVPQNGSYCWTIQSGDGWAASDWATERCFQVTAPTPTLWRVFIPISRK